MKRQFLLFLGFCLIIGCNNPLQNPSDGKIGISLISRASVTINFDGLTASGYPGSQIAAANTWTPSISGFQFRTQDSRLTITTWGTGSNSLYKVDWTPGAVEMQATDGSLFSISSFGVSLGWGYPLNVTLKGYDASNSVVISQSWTNISAAATLSVTSSSVQVKRVEFSYPSSSGGPAALDNIVVSTGSSSPAASPTNTITPTQPNATPTNTITPTQLNATPTNTITPTQLNVTPTSTSIPVTPGIGYRYLRLRVTDNIGTGNITELYDVQWKQGSVVYDATSWWQVTSGFPAILSLDCGTGSSVKPDLIAVQTCWTLDYAPSAFYCEGSNDNANWTVLYSRTGLSTSDYAGTSSYTAFVFSANPAVTPTATILQTLPNTTPTNTVVVPTLTNTITPLVSPVTPTQSTIPTPGAYSWPQDLGPGRNGYTSESGWNSNWPAEGPAVKWRKTVGCGGSTVICANGKVYAIGAFNAGSNVAAGAAPSMVPTINNYSFWGTTFPPFDEWIQCFNAETGSLVWASCIAANAHMDSCLIPRAAPLYYNGKVYCLGQSRMFVCYNADSGAVVWSKNLTTLYSVTTDRNIEFLNAMASPVLADGKIVMSIEVKISTDGPQYMTVAFNPDTGAEVWKHYASPFAWRYDPVTFPCETGWGDGQNSPSYGIIDGKPTVVVATGHAVIGIDARNGNRLWIFNHEKEFADISPTWGNWRFYLQYGYASTSVNIYNNMIIDRVYIGHGSYGSRTFAFEIVGGTPVLRWQTTNLAARWARYAVTPDGKLIGLDIGSTLAASPDELYRVNRPGNIGQLQCIDIASGNLLWSSDAYKQLSWDGTEFGYTYNGDMEYSIAGDRLLIRGRCSYSTYKNDGLFAARITASGITPLGAYSFYTGVCGWGAPVLVNGLCYYRLYDENNGLGANGNLVCFNLR